MYTKKQYLSLAEEVEKTYGYTKVELSQNIIEFMTDQDQPVFQLVFDEKNGEFIISFYVQTAAFEAILIFSSIRKLYSETRLAKEYYIDKHGKLHIGESAEIEAQKDMVQHILKGENEEDDLDDLDLGDWEKSPQKSESTAPKRNLILSNEELSNAKILDTLINKGDAPKKGEHWQ